MDKREILKYVDYTNLKPIATVDDIIALCKEAKQYNTASVCIPPAFIDMVKKVYPELNVCTVIGFPLGYSTKEVKALEAADAIARGADEIDMVININEAAYGNLRYVQEEIQAVRKMTYGKILKVIIETCYLTEKQKVGMCQIVTTEGCDYIKTSTGFGMDGAKLKDVELFKEYIGPQVKIKAAGGIRKLDEMNAYVEAGCSRIGASSIACLID